MSAAKLVEPTTIGGSIASICATATATSFSFVLFRVVSPVTGVRYWAPMLFGFGLAFTLWYGWCLGRAMAERANREEQT